MLRKDNKILLMGDFNCKNVRWEEMEIDGNAEPWSEEMQQLAMVNTLEQWVEEPTRYRGQEVPLLLDLVFPKKPEPRTNIKYLSPMGRNDHVVLKINLKDYKRRGRL